MFSDGDLGNDAAGSTPNAGKLNDGGMTNKVGGGFYESCSSLHYVIMTKVRNDC